MVYSRGEGDMARGRRFLGQVVFVLAVMIAAFVGAKLGLLSTRDVGASHNFNDVPPGAFYHDFVQFLVDNGITAGCGPGLFCGEQAVTRGQIAVFLKKLNDVVRSQTVWAVVDSNGTLARSFHATSAIRVGTGSYEVVFDRDVSGCAFNATLGDPDFSVFSGDVSAAKLFNNPNGVRVVALNMGTAVDRPFHLAVNC
jgi:S-layer homology domain